MSALFDFIGSAVCHRMAERSFLLDGLQLPVCARCAGIYTGILFSMLFFFFAKRLSGSRPYETKGMLFATLSFIPIAIDGLGSYIGFWESNHLLRVITGALAGASLPGLMLLGANLKTDGTDTLPIFQNFKEQFMLCVVVLLWGLSLLIGINSYIVAAFVISGGVLCFWADLLYVLIKSLGGEKKHPWRLAFLFSFLIIVCIGSLLR